MFIFPCNWGKQPEVVQQGKGHAESPQALAVVVVVLFYGFSAAPLLLMLNLRNLCTEEKRRVGVEVRREGKK